MWGEGWCWFSGGNKIEQEACVKFDKAALLGAALVLSGCQAWQNVSTDGHRPSASASSISKGSSLADSSVSSPSSVPSVPFQPVFKMFPIYTDHVPRHTHYAPSGYMGDSDLSMSGAYTATPDGQGPCLRVNYNASGPKGWAGIYWQDPANNWGDVPGHAGFDLRGATKLTFWARGENGGEKVHEFRMGGIVGQYPDSDVASMTSVRLSKDWKEYTIDLKKKDLRHIIGGFGFFVNKAENPGGMVFYLDNILYEGPEGFKLSAATVTAPSPTGQMPIIAPPVAQEMPMPELKPGQKDLKVQKVDTGLRVSFSSQFLFTPGRSNLQEDSGKILDQLISLLSAYPTNKVLIEGHTDSTGDAHFNLRLSELRATSVRDYLIKKGGYETSRFQVIGYGDTRPVADNATKAGRSLNRRVEVTILKSNNP